MPYLKIWIHLIWATKNRFPFLSPPKRKEIFQHIRENAEKKEIHLDFINGCEDHVHLLISLTADQTIAKVVQLLKGESSHWINQKELFKEKFGWQDEYIAVSVSHSAVDKVREYIKNQEEHHRRMSFREEFQIFLDKIGFELYRDAG